MTSKSADLTELARIATALGDYQLTNKFHELRAERNRLMKPPESDTRAADTNQDHDTAGLASPDTGAMDQIAKPVCEREGATVHDMPLTKTTE